MRADLYGLLSILVYTKYLAVFLTYDTLYSYLSFLVGVLWFLVFFQ